MSQKRDNLYGISTWKEDVEIATGKGSHGCDRSTRRPVDVTQNCAQCAVRHIGQRCCAQRRRQTSNTSKTDAGTSTVVDRVQQDIFSHKPCVPGTEIAALIPGFTVDAAVCQPEIAGPTREPRLKKRTNDIDRVRSALARRVVSTETSPCLQQECLHFQSERDQRLPRPTKAEVTTT